MYNKVVLVGRLTHDPELRYTNNGVPIVRYSLAVNRNYKNADGVQETDFLSIVSWRKLAEISAKFLKKGKLVLVEGRVQSRKYQAQDGSPRTTVEIQAEQMQMLDSKGSKYEEEPSTQAPVMKKQEYSVPEKKTNDFSMDDGKQTDDFGNFGPDDIDFEDVPF